MPPRRTGMHNYNKIEITKKKLQKKKKNTKKKKKKKITKTQSQYSTPAICNNRLKKNNKKITIKKKNTKTVTILHASNLQQQICMVKN